MPSLLHTREGLPTKVSSHEVTVTETGVLDAAVTGHEAKPSTSPELVGGQKTSVATYVHRRNASTQKGMGTVTGQGTGRQVLGCVTYGCTRQWW